MKGTEIARSKVKGLRTALKQGEVESWFFLQENRALDILYETFAVRSGGRLRQMWDAMASSTERPVFLPVDGEKRCLYFDAIEVIDHCDFFEEAEI